MKIIFSNKKALHDYEISQKYEAGISLEGWEVKSAKANKLSLNGAFVKEINGELILTGSNIAKWTTDGYAVAREDRDRKLLLQKSEIRNLVSKTKEKGMTMVPIDAYINNKGLIKLTIGLAKGRKKFDKREKLKKLDLQKRIDLEKKYYKF